MKGYISHIATLTKLFDDTVQIRDRSCVIEQAGHVRRREREIEKIQREREREKKRCHSLQNKRPNRPE